MSRLDWPKCVPKEIYYRLVHLVHLSTTQSFCWLGLYWLGKLLLIDRIQFDFRRMVYCTLRLDSLQWNHHLIIFVLVCFWIIFFSLLDFYLLYNFKSCIHRNLVHSNTIITQIVFKNSINIFIRNGFNESECVYVKGERTDRENCHIQKKISKNENKRRSQDHCSHPWRTTLKIQVIRGQNINISRSLVHRLFSCFVLKIEASSSVDKQRDTRKFLLAINHTVASFVIVPSWFM